MNKSGSARRRETFAVADGISAIDTIMTGRYLVTSAYLLDADEPALIETGPTTSSSTASSRGASTEAERERAA